MLRIAWLLGSLLALPAAAESDQDRYSKFIHLMHDKQYPQAVDFAFTWARAGDGWARTQVEEWSGGDGLPEDRPPEVERLVAARLREAAIGGDAKAQLMLGFRILKTGGESRLGEAVGWLEKAADQGSLEARYVLSGMSPEALASRGIRSKYAGKPLSR